MLLTVREFVGLATHKMPELVSQLQETTGRFGDEEKGAWSESLSRVADVFQHADLDGFHVTVGRPSGNLSLEYRLPAASSWCDLVLLGKGAKKPTAVMFELKHWDVTGDRPGPRPGVVLHKGQEMLHPSEQVRGYVEYCQRFHSAVQDSGAEVLGCTLLTAARHADAYTSPPHDLLTQEYPVLTASPRDASEHLPRYLRSHLCKPDSRFAEEFEEGVYQQDRCFVSAVAEALLDPERADFVLLDAQRFGFEKCLQVVDECFATMGDRKAVIIVEGPPGSGKSVLAARLWATLAQDARIKGSIVFTTTSGSQKSNWESIYERLGSSRAARGIVIAANKFNPGLTPIWVNAQRKKKLSVTVDRWRSNLALYKRMGNRSRIADDSMAVTIVDEAHALIDSSAPGAAGVPPSGWCHHAGPQAWHVIRGSQVSVFFMDAEQSYRDNETTTAERIRACAKDQGARILSTISLGDAQFRCAGSKEYVDWVEALLSGGTSRPTSWRSTAKKKGFDFEIVDDPEAMDERLRAHLRAGRTARLLAAYGRQWKTKGVVRPHALSPAPDGLLHSIPTWRQSKDLVPHLELRPWNGLHALRSSTGGQRSISRPAVRDRLPLRHSRISFRLRRSASG